MLGFRGLGYSESFVKNMIPIVDKDINTPDTKIEIVASGDSICSACPHQNDENCLNGNVCNKDKADLSLININSGDIITSGEAYKKIAGNITVEDLNSKLCPNCNWRSLGYCSEGLHRLKEHNLQSFYVNELSH